MRGSHRPPSYFQVLYSKIVGTFTFYNKPAGRDTELTFRPENYDLLDSPRMLGFTTKLFRDPDSEKAMIAHDIFMAKDSRSWTRLRVHVQLNPQQRYFGHTAGSISDRAFQLRRERQLPYPLQKMLEDPFDEDHDEMQDDLEITSTLSEDNETLSWPTIVSRGSSSFRRDLQAVTEMIRHRDICVVSEEEVVVVQGDGVYFFAQFENQWFRYCPIVDGEQPLLMTQRRLESMFALRNAPHVLQLAGIVVDNKCALFKGLLMALARRGALFGFLAKKKREGQPVGWPMRQKWAKQIVKAVASFHDRGQTCRNLTTLNHSISLDEGFDVLIGPSTKFSHPATTEDLPGSLPPECRTAAFTDGSGEISPTFDLFQLGLLLWHLYRDELQLSVRSFCLVAGCPNAMLNSCEQHKNPIALPRASHDVPDYYEKIINLCRQEDPRSRPSARKLLDMFPSDSEISRQIIASGSLNFDMNSAQPLTRLEEVRSLYGRYTVCDICSSQSTDISYFCQACSNGDYDLCRKCFDEGLHCRDRTHVLIEEHHRYNTEHGPNRRAIQYSSVGHHGNRNRIVC